MRLFKGEFKDRFFGTINLILLILHIGNESYTRAHFQNNIHLTYLKYQLQSDNDEDLIMFPQINSLKYTLLHQM